MELEAGRSAGIIASSIDVGAEPMGRGDKPNRKRPVASGPKWDVVSGALMAGALGSFVFGTLADHGLWDVFALVGGVGCMLLGALAGKLASDKRERTGS